MVSPEISFPGAQTAAFSCPPVPLCPCILDVLCVLISFSFSFFFFFFLAVLLCFWVLVSRPRIEIGPLAVKVLSPNHWPCRGFCSLFLHREPSDWTRAYPSDFVEFNYLAKNIIYKYSHIPKCWRLGLLQIIF